MCVKPERRTKEESVAQMAPEWKTEEYQSGAGLEHLASQCNLLM